MSKSFRFVALALSVGAGWAIAQTEEAQIRMPGSPLGIAWAEPYGYQGVKAETFVQQVRQLGGGISKVSLFWNQIEPEKGRFDWTAVDQFVRQLRWPEEGMISLVSSSLWATKRPAAVLPPSPANNAEDYYRFVNMVVRRSKGRVRYWQNGLEPNNPVYWTGSKEEFVEELKTFHRAVKDADPKAVVVAAGFDGLFNPPDMTPIPGQQRSIEFFDYAIRAGAPYFDVFDLHLYGDPYTIPYRVDTVRQMMLAEGHDKPVICTEYNGPGFFEFRANQRYMPLILRWTQSVMNGNPKQAPGSAQDGLADVAALYGTAGTLAPPTQMFLQGCAPVLEKKLERLQARDLAMRNVLAFSAGVQKTMYQGLWRDTSKRNELLQLLYGKMRLMDYEGTALKKRLPVAEAFLRVATALEGIHAVRRISVPGKPSIFLFEVARLGGKASYVVWERRDAFSGEDSPAVPFEWPSKAKNAKAVSAMGQPVPASIKGGHLRLPVSVTPVFVELVGLKQ